MSSGPAFAVDLDDTLFPQWEYLEGAAAATAARAGALGLDAGEFRLHFVEILRAGSAAGGTIDRTLSALGVPPEQARPHVPPLVEAFAGFRPARLTCYPGASAALEALRRLGPVALYTDGRADIQRAKLAALGLADSFDLVLVTDEAVGRDRRKPDPAGILRIAEAFCVPAAAFTVIGDRVDKDLAVAARVGASAIRVRGGEYADVPTPAGVLEVPSFADAVGSLSRAGWPST